MISPTTYAAGALVYLLIGLAAWQIADRHNFKGDNWRLIYRWPGVAAVAVVVLAMVWPVIRDETRDDRAQMGPTPIWIPGLLTLLVILAIVLNELVLHIVPTRGPLGEMQSVYAVDTTPQLVLLAVAVATVALTKVVGWYRRRPADG
jgi:hypothetical protein